MAMIKQELFVIRDTLINKLMLGAKSQIAFDSKGAARRSLVHTGWWEEFKRRQVILSHMPNGAHVLQLQEQLEAEFQIQYARDWKTVNPVLRKQLAGISADIGAWAKSSHGLVDTEIRKIKFDNQKRYVVEYLINIETKEI